MTRKKTPTLAWGFRSMPLAGRAGLRCSVAPPQMVSYFDHTSMKLGDIVLKSHSISRSRRVQMRHTTGSGGRELSRSVAYATFTHVGGIGLR